MIHRRRLDPRKTGRELRRRERDAGIRRRVDSGYVIAGIAFILFVVAMVALYFSTYK